MAHALSEYLEERHRSLSALLAREWDESDHPRDERGRFDFGDSGGGDKPDSAGLSDYLTMVAQAQVRNNSSRQSAAGFVLANGKQYKVTADSFSGKRDKANLCYMNAGRIAMHNPARTYVEGYITVHGVPVQHAWTVDNKGHVFDSTLKNDNKIEGWFGVPFTTKYVGKTGLKTGVWGIISHTNPGLFDAKSMVGIVEGAKVPPASSTPAQDLFEKNHSDEVTMVGINNQFTETEKAKMAKANAEMEKLKPTNVEFVDAAGKYTQERQALHADILDKMFSPKVIKDATPKAGVKPVLILTGGRPAAGKTSALRSELKGDVKSIYISADTIQENLPGYRADHAGIFNGEGQDIALQAERIAMEAGLNITYDATMKSPQPALDRVDLYKANGYEVHGYFVHTTPATSAIRSVQRFETTGRYVPPLVSFNSRSNEKTFDTLIPKLDKWALYDNNGKKPIRVAGGEK